MIHNGKEHPHNKQANKQKPTTKENNKNNNNTNKKKQMQLEINGTVQ